MEHDSHPDPERLPRGVHWEGHMLGSNRALLVIDSRGVILARCCMLPHRVDEEFLAALRAWLDRTDCPRLTLI